MNESRITHLDWFWLLAIASLSFSFFGLPYYPFLNSDIAVHVYMTESFSFVNDLYYWSQDRLGSLVPLFGYLLHSSLGVPPIWACAISEWFFLIIAVGLFWSFFHYRWQRWFFTLVFFFPCYEMYYILLPGHPYGEQMAFLALSFVLFNSLLETSRLSLLPWFLLCSIVSIWISDFSLLFFPLFLPIFWRPILHFFSSLNLKRHLISIIFSLLVVLSGALFLIYAKQRAASDPAYINAMFSDYNQLLHTLDLMWFYTKNVILFDSVTNFNSLMFFATFFACLILVIFHKRFFRLTSWSRYFLFSSLISFIVLLSLRWVSVNYVMLKYFIPSFVFLWAGLFSIKLPSDRIIHKLFGSSLFFSVIGGSLGGLFLLVNPKQPIVSHEKLSDLALLAPVHIIGDYWCSYVLGVADPHQIRTTPHDQSFVRNFSFSAEVMRSDTIYLVKEDWFESFPDSTTQFGVWLIRSGNDFSLSGYTFAPYTKR